MRVAALDFGSNTFLLLIAEVDSEGVVKDVLVDECIVTRLAEGVSQTKKICSAAFERAEKCFIKFSESLQKYPVQKIQAVATSAARDAENGADFFALAKRYNIPVDIISGAKEAELTYLGARANPLAEGSCVVDVGGGSTEIISCAGGEITGHSLDLGCVRLTEMFIDNHPTLPAEILSIDKYIDAELEKYKDKLPVIAETIVGVAGTPTTLAAMDLAIKFNADKIDDYKLSLLALEQWRERIAKLDLPGRLDLVGMNPGREDVIIAGISILIKAMKFFNLTELFVSTRGVRYGLASQLGKK